MLGQVAALQRPLLVLLHQHRANRKRVRRPMGLTGLAAAAPGPRTSRPHPQHPKHPCLLRRLAVDRPNQARACDITCLPMARGFLYLAAAMDWHSRKVLSWRVSSTLDAGFCAAALREALALARHGSPDVFNNRPGRAVHRRGLHRRPQGARHPDSQRRQGPRPGQPRLWRTVKYEHAYLKPAEDGTALKRGLAAYFDCYNQRRGHSALDGKTPDEVYFQPGKQRQAA